MGMVVVLDLMVGVQKQEKDIPAAITSKRTLIRSIAQDV